MDLFQSGKMLLTGQFDEFVAKMIGKHVTKKLFKVGGKLTKKLQKKKEFKKIKNEQKSKCTDGNCFVEDTLIHTEKVYVKIRDIMAGDFVYSMDEQTGEIGLKRVEETSTSSVHTMFEIEIGKKEKIKATKYHPFYVEDKAG